MNGVRAAIREAAVAGAGMGLAVAAVEVWTNAARMLSSGVPMPVEIAVAGAALLVALGAVIGVATIGAARSGGWWHPAVMVVVWLALQLYAAPEDRDGRMTAVVVALGGGGLVALGRWFDWSRDALVVLGIAIVASGMAAPELQARRRAPRISHVPPVAAAPVGAPDVVVVVLDGVRADHLGAYGYGTSTSPVFDRVAREGALYTDAVSPAASSFPSHASLFTGRFVSAHGAHDEHLLLDGATPTLAETLAGHGFDTRAFTANPWIADRFGTTRGFAWVDEEWRGGDGAWRFQSGYRLLDRVGGGWPDKGGADVTLAFEQWAHRAGPRPMFVFLSFLDADVPHHQVPAEFLARFTTRSRRELRSLSVSLTTPRRDADAPMDAATVGDATAMYDAGVAYADHLLGRVVDALARRGTLDRTVLVVLAGHGAFLGEHGAFGHGPSLYEPALHVPLVVRYPPKVRAGTRVETTVSAVGVYATVLELAGLPAVPTAQVESLVSMIDGKPHPGPIIAEQYRAELGSTSATDDPLLEPRTRYRAFRSGRWKLVDAEPGGTFLFDLKTDPGE